MELEEKQKVLFEQVTKIMVSVSEDFSYFAQKVPGLIFRLGGLPNDSDPKTAGSYHIPQFMVDDKAFKLGVITFCNLMFDYVEVGKK